MLHTVGSTVADSFAGLDGDAALIVAEFNDDDTIMFVWLGKMAALQG